MLDNTYVYLKDTGRIVLFGHDIDTTQIDVTTHSMITSTYDYKADRSTNGAMIKVVDNKLVVTYPPKTKQQLVSEIIVTTTTGKVFDGDELSQDRMLRALAIADLNGQTETQWKMADNSVQTVTREDLKEALTLAGLAMSEIWINN